MLQHDAGPVFASRRHSVAFTTNDGLSFMLSLVSTLVKSIDDKRRPSVTLESSLPLCHCPVVLAPWMTSNWPRGYIVISISVHLLHGKRRPSNMLGPSFPVSSLSPPTISHRGRQTMGLSVMLSFVRLLPPHHTAGDAPE